MKKLKLLMARCYAWLIYCLPFGAIISLFISLFLFAVSDLINLPSFFAVLCFFGAHDSLYCWRHGHHIVPSIEPLKLFYKRLISEEYYENYNLVTGVVATIGGTILFGVGTVIFIQSLLGV